MTKKGISVSSLFNDPYARRYFVLKGRYLFYYSTRQEYRDDPTAAIKSKPIDIVGYNVNRVVEGNSFKLLLEVRKYSYTKFTNVPYFLLICNCFSVKEKRARVSTMGIHLGF